MESRREPDTPSTVPGSDPATALRSRGYVGLLVLAALLGAPVAVAAFGFLHLVDRLQEWSYTDLPAAVGFQTVPLWWPFVPLTVAGLLVAAAIRYLPGRGGPSPTQGVHTSGGAPAAVELPGIALAALASLGLGAVLGPEGPLVALGGGLALMTVRLVRPGAPERAARVVAVSGSFAAISTLLGSPLVGAFLLMEAIGIAGASATVVLLPGLVGAGVGSLIFIGLGDLTGLGTFSLAIPDVPAPGVPTLVEFVWAVVVGLAAAALCLAIRRFSRGLEGVVDRAPLLTTPVLGAAVAGVTVLYAAVTGRPSSDVLFSGQATLPDLIEDGAGLSAGALVLLAACKAAAYALSLAGFRGGPTFPAMLVGAAGGLAVADLAGLDPVSGAAMGIGAMAVGMLRLPLTSVLLTTLFLGAAGITVMPLVIVAVVVSYVASARLEPPPGGSAPQVTRAGG